ncbi:MAG: tetratricopeptide repeat protein [Bacteroidota bacterium]
MKKSVLLKRTGTRLRAWCYFFFICTATFGQSKTDSLQAVLQTASTDSLKVEIMHQLFEEYLYQSPSKARETILQSISLAEKSELPQLLVNGINNYADYLYRKASYDSAIFEYERSILLAERAGYNLGKTEALIGLGNTYLNKGNPDKALEYQEQNIELSRQIGDLDGVASSYNNMGNIYNELGEYTKAMEHYILSSKQYIELGDEKSIGITKANIGMIHGKLDNYEEAIRYYSESDSLFKKTAFIPGRVFVLKNMATISKNTRNFKQAIQYNLQARESYQKMGHRREEGQVEHSIANIYWEQDDLKSALPHYQQAYAIATEIQDSISIAMTSQALGACYLALGKHSDALKYSKQASDIATAAGIKLTVMDAYKTLAKSYYRQNEFREAYDNLMAHLELRDSLYTMEKRDLASDIEAKYQNEQKAQEIALLESENDLQTLQIDKRENERNYLIAFAAVSLILIGLVYNQYRIKQKANTKLKELDHLKSDFFANISHEFRTPLSLIMGPLKEKIIATKSPKDKAQLEMMYRNADRLYQLINQLLDLSKLEDGKLTLQKSKVNVCKYFRVIAASFTSLAEYKQIAFKCLIPESTIEVEFDKEIVEKASNNLLSNAFKFTPEGGSVTLAVSVEKRSLVIKVSDSGPGIRQEDQTKVFDRFYQTPGAEKLGTGIGLALTKELVELHQGTISLESKPQEGSTFIVRIPIEKVDEIKANEEVVVNKLEGISIPKSEEYSDEESTIEGPKILVVEDNPDLQDYLGELMGKQYKIYKAGNGEEGIKMAKEIIPDLIISDVMMPIKSGMEVCDELKNALETNHIPIVLLTARADQESKLKGLTTGADVYLQKPFDPQELSVIVSNLLEQRVKLKEKYAKLIQLAPEEIEITSNQEIFLQQVMKIVNEHLDNPEFSVEQFCKETGLSRMQLHRKLSSLTGFSTTAFIRHQRVLRAAKLLESGMPVSDVAYATGFGSLSYFTNVFKKEHGVTPSAYAESKVNG